MAANKYDMVLRDYPELTPKARMVIQGHVTTLVEIIGKKGIRVEIDSKDPAAWHWRISWQS